MAVWRWVAGGIVALAAYNGTIGVVVQGQREALLSRAAHDAEVMTATLTGEIEASLDAVDRTLSGIAEVMRAAPGRLVPQDMDAHRLLMRRHAITPLLKTLILVGPDGRMVNSSAARNTPPTDVSDRDYFQAQRTSVRDEMFIGVPIKSRLDGSWILPVSRALENSYGELQVVVAASVSPESIRALISGQRLQDGFRVAVQSPSGQFVACDGLPGCSLDASLTGGPFEGLKGGGRTVAFLPGGAGPGAFTRGERYNFVTAAVIDHDTVLIPWRKTVPAFIGLSLLGSLAIIVGLAILCRQVAARREAMAALAEANIDLEARVQERTRELSESEDRLRSFIRATLDAVVIIDGAGMVTEFNPAATRLFGYEPRDIIGRSVNLLMPESYARHHDRHVVAASQSGERAVGRERQMVGRHQDGREFPVELTIGTRILGGKVIHVGVIRDITERKATEDTLRRLANIDGLTGVFNRRSFMEEGERQFAIALRHSRNLSALMIDADHFKSVNDTHGHDIGDIVLKTLAKVIASRLRETDIFGRLGGEEFAVVLPETDRHGAEQIGWAVVEAVRATEVALPNGEPLCFTVSVGVGSRMEGGESLNRLLKDADAALYAAKNGGRNRVVAQVPGETTP